MLHTEKGATLKYNPLFQGRKFHKFYIVCNIENMGGPGDEAKVIGYRVTTHTYCK